MDDKDLKALNEKLLKFAGFKNIKDERTLYGILADYPDNPTMIECVTPNITKDANTQIKYLYPKIYNLLKSVYGDNNILLEWNSEYKEWYCQINLIETFDATDKEQSIAFALACEKYIDSSGVNNENSNK
jgi:hypothetical protein